MDIWTATARQITDIAEKRTSKKAIEVYRPSGLYAWVTMEDGSIVIVYESEL